MTADQFERLAHMADQAADHFRRTNPSRSRTMAAAATAAHLAAAEQRDAEDLGRMRAQLEEIKAALR
jgi:hypothetical protein